MARSPETSACNSSRMFRNWDPFYGLMAQRAQVIQPDARHLMLQPPALEMIQQSGQFEVGCPHFLQVVPEPIGPNIRYRVVILANVCQHAHESLAFRCGAASKGALTGCQQERKEHPAILLD